MKFTLSWLKDYLDTDVPVAEITHKLTSIGLEVESVTNDEVHFLVAEVVEVHKHPNADSLHLCKVNDGTEVIQVVCGAANVRAGIKVVFAKIGAVIPETGMIIKKSKIRGVSSSGMLCAASELGLSDSGDGILELGGEFCIGDSFFTVDPVIEVAITPNRGDCLGVYGIARDLASAGIGTLKEIALPGDSFNSLASPTEITVDNEDLCSCFFGCYIKGVQNIQTPEWLRKRLISIGIKPNSGLVDIANYFMMSFNRPVHLYDADKLSGDLVIRSAAKDEKFTALNQEKYVLDESVCVVADSVGVQGIAGVIGGASSCCDIDTQNVFLELALFDCVSIGISSRKLGVTTDSSYRFERGLDEQFVERGLEVLVDMIISLCGGEAFQPVKFDARKTEQKKITLDFQRLEKIVGCGIDQKKAANILENLGFVFDNNCVIAPSWRHDIDGEADIVEEFFRIYGYDNIPEVVHPSMFKRSSVDVTVLNRRLLVARGMYEVITWSFMDAKDAICDEGRLIKIKNPISSNCNVMRDSVFPNLISVMHSNFARGESGVAIFEIGSVYSNLNTEKLITGIRSGLESKKNIYGASRKYDVFDVKADVISILEQYNIKNTKLSNTVPEHYHPGKSGAFVLGKVVVAYFGELVIEDKYQTMAFEVFLDRIPNIKKTKQSGELSVYQSVYRDFAFIVSEAVTVGEITNVVKTVDRELIKEINVFDIHRGEDIGSEKKSVAISVKLQAQDRTLIAEELESLHLKVVKSVKSAVGGILRSEYVA